VTSLEATLSRSAAGKDTSPYFSVKGVFDDVTYDVEDPSRAKFCKTVNFPKL